MAWVKLRNFEPFLVWYESDELNPYLLLSLLKIIFYPLKIFCDRYKIYLATYWRYFVADWEYYVTYLRHFETDTGYLCFLDNFLPRISTASIVLAFNLWLNLNKAAARYCEFEIWVSIEGMWVGTHSLMIRLSRLIWSRLFCFHTSFSLEQID